MKWFEYNDEIRLLTPDVLKRLNRDCTILDIATTNRSYENGRITELSYIQFSNGNIKQDTIHITEENEKDMSYFITYDLMYGKEKLIISHDTKIKMNFIDRMVERGGGYEQFWYDFIDLRWLVKNHVPDIPNLKLQDMSIYFNVDKIDNVRGTAYTVNEMLGILYKVSKIANNKKEG